MKSSYLYAIFAVSFNQEHRCKFERGKLYWLAGVVGKGVPIIVRGRNKKAQKLAWRLKKKGYQVKVLGKIKRREANVSKIEPTVATERPYCRGCRERDKVVLPSDPLPEKKWFREPYCIRCKSMLRIVTPHRLQPNDFD